ncbi:MAG: M20/M25/M40 family metallo-hydrolase [Isosphaeraceae bacterium]
MGTLPGWPPPFLSAVFSAPRTSCKPCHALAGRDALLSASRLVVAVNDVIRSVPGRQVGTVGTMDVQPGAYNVIPGKVVLGLEIRDLSAEKIESLFSTIEKRAADIADSSGTSISFKRRPNESRPALASPAFQQKILAAAESLGLSHKLMPSGAGHDSQEIAHIAPVAMIFVPSVAGISHSPKEHTTATDMANGAKVLLKTILALDRE